MGKIDVKMLGVGFFGLLLLLGGIILVYFMVSDPFGYFIGYTDNFAFLVTPFILIILGLIFMVGGFASVSSGKKEAEEVSQTLPSLPEIPPPPPPPPTSLSSLKRYCTYCGAELQEDQRFCGHCGKEVTS